MKFVLLAAFFMLHAHVHAAWGSILPAHFDGHKINAIVKPAGEAKNVKGEPLEFICENGSIHSVWLKNKNVEPLSFGVGHAHRTSDSSRDRITAHNQHAIIRINSYDHLAINGTVYIAARDGKPPENWEFQGMLTRIDTRKPEPKEGK